MPLLRALFPIIVTVFMVLIAGVIGVIIDGD